ncbi:MAG: hypothetical protein QOH39_2777 [Verrucomicrobiota bacterium]|jgi:hypothetical protein
MNSGHLHVTASAVRPARKTKARKKVRTSNGKNGHSNGNHPPTAAAGTLTRTKSLLLAALRVWELKHRVGE